MKTLRQLWLDDRAAVLSMELVLVATIIVLGMIVGLTTYRDAVVQELGDTASAIAELDQGYMYTTNIANLPVLPNVTFTVSVAGSDYVDATDFCQEDDVGGQEPACISVRAAATAESDMTPAPAP